MCQHTGASLSYFGHLLKVDNMINYFPNNLQVEIVQVKVKHSKKVNREHWALSSSFWKEIFYDKFSLRV